MKRIIDGMTYNTDTATIVARYEYVDDRDYETEAILYQSRGGAFFLVHKWEVDGNWKYLFESMSRSEVDRLVEKTDNLEIIDEAAITEPPEAEAESEPGATLYVRVPASLKRRVDEAAKDEKLSGNVWAMRCVERCLEPKKALSDYPDLVYIWEISSSTRIGVDWDRDKCVEALEEIAKYTEILAETLNVDLTGLSAASYFDATSDDLRQKFRPLAD